MEEKVTFNEMYCKSCGLCIQVCPTNVIFLADHINANGYRPATVMDQDRCISCAKCGQVCPDSVISVYKPIKQKLTV